MFNNKFSEYHYIDDMYSKNALNSYQFYIYQTYQIYTGSQYKTSHQFCAFRVGLNHVPFVFEFESPLFKRIFRAPNKRTVAITVNRAFAQCVDLFSCNLSSPGLLISKLIPIVFSTVPGVGGNLRLEQLIFYQMLLRCSTAFS
ncbi:Hypothetical_protein [Hexamita inflata]|uniref:Hypothetical_protein n=1 Tax=Hexamita inflata TaxID=28002 RepID=A0AA86P5E3_9EUKA|nr:Hypothetical protein HINF_LOCUS20187 [Hexamita inflata]